MRRGLLLFLFLLTCLAGICQVRSAAVAGAFYPEKPEKLFNVLADLLPKRKNEPKSNPQALIVPHAGYAFSGEVAAQAYLQIPAGADYERIFLIGASHTKVFPGASVFAMGNYKTPFGEVKLDTAVVQKLLNESPYFSFRPSAHIKEHSLEVQLPMLQYRLARSFKIVPILLSSVSIEDIRGIAKALKPWFNEKNLFIISSDFSHYPAYLNARLSDSLCAAAILTNSLPNLQNTVQLIQEADIPHLSTTMCGKTAIMTLLALSQTENDLKFRHLMYRNSGQTKFGNLDKVVGYHAFAIHRSESPGLSAVQKKMLLNIARASLQIYLKTGEKPDFDRKAFAGKLDQTGGVFVSLYKKEKLRGCMGRFQSLLPLYETTSAMSVVAAVQDQRFEAITLEELVDLKIEISVLSPLRKISNTSEIEIGKHGIYLVKGDKSGTLLPKVAKERGWNAIEFLSQCSDLKAGIGRDGWREGSSIYIYTAEVFGE